MPIISVTMTKEQGGLSKEQKSALIAELSATFVKIVGRGEKTCVVTINEIECENYGIGGFSVEKIRQENDRNL